MIYLCCICGKEPLKAILSDGSFMCEPCANIGYKPAKK